MHRLAVLSLFLIPALLQDAPDRERPRPKDAAPDARIGAPAPAFRLNDHEGKLVEVGGKAGHWTVIAFYPKALTGG